jgi:hypothetical protein
MDTPIRIQWQKPDFEFEELGRFTATEALAMFRQFEWDAAQEAMWERAEDAGDGCPPSLFFFRQDLPDETCLWIALLEEHGFFVRVEYMSTKRRLGIFPPGKVTKTRENLVAAQVQAILQRFLVATRDELPTVLK